MDSTRGTSIHIIGKSGGESNQQLIVVNRNWYCVQGSIASALAGKKPKYPRDPSRMAVLIMQELLRTISWDIHINPGGAVHTTRSFVVDCGTHNVTLGSSVMHFAQFASLVETPREIRRRQVHLSPHELRYLQALAADTPPKEIAEAFGISQGTVSNYIRDARLKLGARTSTGAVLAARELELI